jgi:penicillin amidase
LVSARYRLTVDIAKNTEDWQWGRIHTVELTHPLFVGTDSSSPLAALFNPRRLPVSGGSCSLNATNWNPQTGPEVVSGPTMRMVVDLANLDDSTWVVLTGVSGHPGSRHYTDQIAAWADGRTYQWPFSLAAVQDDAKNTLTFKPTR